MAVHRSQFFGPPGSLARLAALFEQPLAEAVATGSCRPDLRVEELPLLINMLGAGLRGRTVKERLKLARRAFEIVRFGLTS